MPLPAFSPPSEARRKNMAAIRSQDTRPEIAVRSAVHAAGFRFRLRNRAIPGNPDIVLPRYEIAVLVHGCFWHGHGCKRAHTPKTNSKYWSAKIRRNIARDSTNAEALAEAGWKIVTIWECSLESGIESLKNLLVSLENSKSEAAEV